MIVIHSAVSHELEQLPGGNNTIAIVHRPRKEHSTALYQTGNNERDRRQTAPRWDVVLEQRGNYRGEASVTAAELLWRDYTITQWQLMAAGRQINYHRTTIC
jgi:hypothetical protein